MRVLFLISVLLISLGTAAAQERPDLLRRHIPSIKLGSKTISEVLTALAEDYDVPIANEISNETTKDATSSSVSELKNAQVEEILTTLFANRSEYRWQLTDGIIRVSSLSESEPLFDTVITDFCAKDQTVSEIKKALAERPEVQSVLSETDREFQEFTILPGGNAEPSGKYTFALNNATLRQILNRLILQTKGHYWTLVKLGNNKQVWIIVR